VGVTSLNPIVILPGIGGSVLESTISGMKQLLHGCTGYRDYWKVIWCDVIDLLPTELPCFLNAISLYWNNKTQDYENADGVGIRPKDFGGTSGVTYVTPSVPYGPSQYMSGLIEALIKAGGKDGVSVRAAPYDWRYTPFSKTGKKFHADLKKLIETMYKDNGNKRVTILGHSLGGPQSLYFLQQQSLDWKNQYINAFIAAAPAWGGSGGAVKEMATGHNQGAPVLENFLVGTERTWEANYWLLPTPQVWGKTPFAYTDKRNYTTNDYDAFFKDFGYTEGGFHYKRLKPLYDAMADWPDVTVHMMYSTEHKTPYAYSWDYYSQIHPTAKDDWRGDGTMPTIAMEWPLSTWSSKANFFRTVFNDGNSESDKTTHTGILFNDKFLKQVIEVVNTDFSQYQ